MVDTAVAMSNYDSIIDHQHKRIGQLEADLARYSDKIRVLKTRATEKHHAAFVAAAAVHANDYARAHAAQMQAMLAMANQAVPQQNPHMHAAAAHAPLVPASSRLPGPPLPSPPTPNFFAAQAHAAAAAAAAVAARPHASQEEDERAGKTRYWTEMEHNQFLYAVKLFGPKNYVAISQFVGTRTPKQVRTHAQKYQMRLEREAKKRRAQAAAVTAPGAAAVAAAAAAAVYKGEHPISIPAMAHMPVPVQVVTPVMPVRIKKTYTSAKSHVKMETDAAQSESTCPTFTDETNLDEMDILRGSACSPVSNDSDDEMQTDMDQTSSEDAHSAGAPGMKKNGSLGNLADYDDFMRRITSAVLHQRNESTEMFDASSSDIDVDILNTPAKTEQFEDALLADL